MRWLKKILRIITILLPSFLFFLGPSVSAASYSVDRIPAFNLHGPSTASLYNSLSISFDSSYGVPDGFDVKSQLAYRLDQPDCQLNLNNRIQTWYSSNYSFTYSFTYYDHAYSGINYSQCNNLDHNPPFEYGYFNLTSNVNHNGVDYSHVLEFKDLFTISPQKFRSLTIPFGIPAANVSSSSSMEFTGGFFFDGSFVWGDSSTSSFRLYYSYIADNNGNPGSIIENHVDCNINRILSSDGTLLNYSCPITTPLNIYQNYIGFWLQIENNSSPFYVWETNGNTRFIASYVITDNDFTPGGSFSQDQVGFNPTAAPGYALGEDNSGDFFSSLVNLFSFNFVNPFLPIFSLFTDNSSCVQIPILAGMLHSQETQYCPWFDSNTRSILTPVMSFIGIMLVFGFLVRWLGSSSGNMFEDSGHIQPPGSDLQGKHGWRVK